jgi:hypothetical protein
MGGNGWRGDEGLICWGVSWGEMDGGKRTSPTQVTSAPRKVICVPYHVLLVVLFKIWLGNGQLDNRAKDQVTWLNSQPHVLARSFLWYATLYRR